MRRTVLPLLLMSVLASPAGAQDESSLKRAFEGREVTLLIAMPASHRGIDLRPQHEPDIDLPEYGRRIKQFGVSLRRGDRVMVTLVKVNKQNIEFHLGAGGYGTWGDDNGSVFLPVVTKSDREKRLERDIKGEGDRERRRRMERELSELRNDRQRDERERDQRQRELSAIKEREVADRRLDAGSRFNIWYDDKRLEQWAPTPEELQFAVGRYLAFVDDEDVPMTDARVLDPGPGGVSGLRRGLTVDAVHELLGTPTRRRSSTQGDLETVVETWELVDSVTEVTFVGDVVVKFATSSR